MPIHIIRLMFSYAELLPADSKKADPMIVACALALRIVILGIRFEHATRASRLPEECDDRKDVWLFSKGKDGPRTYSRSGSMEIAQLGSDQPQGGHAHTENILVKHFSSTRGHEQSQAVVMPLHVIQLMFSYAELLPADPKKADPLMVACALVLRILILGIRFEHATRASRLPDEFDDRKDIWLFSKGKDGQPFKLPLPTHTRADMPLMARLQNYLKAQLGTMADSILVPDMALPHGGLQGRRGSEAQILPQRMKYGRFNKLIRDVVHLLAA